MFRSRQAHSCLDFLQNLKSVSIINFVFEMQMFKNVLTFLRYHFVALVFALFMTSFSHQTLQISKNLNALRDRICRCLYSLCTTLYIA